MLTAPMTDVTLERTSPEMEYATVSRWLKREGERVTAGEVLLEIEADKATQEVVAPVSGVLRDDLRACGRRDPGRRGDGNDRRGSRSSAPAAA